MDESGRKRGATLSVIGRALVALLAPGLAVLPFAILFSFVGGYPDGVTAATAPAPASREATPSAAAAPAAAPAPPASASPREAGAAPPRRAPLAREGPFWVETVTGIESGPPARKLSVVTMGAVTVTGKARTTLNGAVRYALIKRVKAGSEAQARRLLDQYRVRSARADDVVQLQFTFPGSDAQTAELKIEAPRDLREVEVETHGGAVTLSDLDGSVHASTGGGPISLDRIGGAGTVLTAGGEIVVGTIGGSLTCKSAGGAIRSRSIGGDAVLGTNGGDIVVDEVRGSVRAATAGGGVKIGRAGYSVVAETAGGTIDIGQAGGDVRASNLGGPIRIGSADGVTIESGGGAIRLQNVSGQLRAATVVGDIIVGLAGGGHRGDSLLSTGGGDITVIIPSGLSLTIRAENSSPGARRIVSDFPDVRVRTVGPLAVAEGNVHGGGPLLRLASGGGTIYIKQEDPSRPRGAAAKSD